MKRFLLFLAVAVLGFSADAYADNEPTLEELKAAFEEIRDEVVTQGYDWCTEDDERFLKAYNGLNGRTFKAKEHDIYSAFVAEYNDFIGIVCRFKIESSQGYSAHEFLQMAMYIEPTSPEQYRIRQYKEGDEWQLQNHPDVKDFFVVWRDYTHLMQLIEDERYTEFDIEVKSDGSVWGYWADGNKSMDFTKLPYTEPETVAAFKRYWKWYYNLVVPGGNPDYDKMYPTRLWGRRIISRDLYDIHIWKFSKLVYCLADILWQEKGVDVQYYGNGKKRWNQQKGAFDKLFDINPEEIKFILLHDTERDEHNDLYKRVESIIPTRPEQAVDFFVSDSLRAICKELHAKNLERWGLTEDEYWNIRYKNYANWTDFYNDMEVRAAKKLEADRAHNEAVENDRRVMERYKPMISAAFDADNPAEADRLAAEARGQLKHSSEHYYLLYAKARSYYERELDWGERYDDDITAYMSAYRAEAEELKRLSQRSINLNSSSENPSYFLRGIANYILRRTDDAVSDFRKAMGSMGVDYCYYNIGVVYASAGRYQSAIENMKLARSNSTDEKMRSQCLNRIEQYQRKLEGK